MSERASGQSGIVRRLKKLAVGSIRQSRRVVGSRRGRSFQSLGEYFSRVPAIGYVGWVGKSNLGDEALYDAFTGLFPNDRLISTYDPFPIELSLHALLVRKNRLFNGVMLGGGTLIFHKGYIKFLRDAQRRGIPTAVFGTGVIDAEFWSKRLGGLGYEPRKDE